MLRARLLLLALPLTASLAACPPPGTTPPPPEVEPTTNSAASRVAAPVATALEKLPDASAVDVSDDGIPHFVVGDLGALGVRPSDAGFAAAVDSVLPAVAELFLVAPADLAPAAPRVDPLGHGRVVYAQTQDGLDVVGGALQVHVNASGRLIAATGTAREINLPSTPTVDAGAAASTAAGVVSGVTPEVGMAKLVYVISSATRAPHLAWEVRVKATLADGPFDEKVYVDALSGEIADRHPLIHTAKLRRIFDSGNTDGLGALAMVEGDAPVADSTVMHAYDNTGKVYDCYSVLAGRDSFDEGGASINSVVHLGQSYNNAFWHPELRIMAYGDGDGTNFAPFARSLDVTAHEFTHAVTSHEANLVYANEPGALNEAMSDILAAVCEAWHDGGVSADTWLIGEDVYTPATPGDALRYMDNPTKDGQSTDYYPERFTGPEDNGGVHLNSGIPNLAFVLLTQGGSHPRGKTTIEVPAIGMEQAAWSFYRALTTYLTPTSSFTMARHATAQAALDLYGPQTAAAVHLAWSAVGVAAAPVDAAPPAGSIELASGVPVTGLSLDAGQAAFYYLKVPASARQIHFTATADNGDVDLYARLGAPFTSGFPDGWSAQAGSVEALTVAPLEGTWFLTVHGYAATTNITIEASYNTAEPAGVEACENGLDDDGDGLFDCADFDCHGALVCGQYDPAPAELVITEIMANPISATDPAHEWFELHNTTAHDLGLGGYTITDGDGSPMRTFTVPHNFLLPAGGYATFAATADATLGFVPTVLYGTNNIRLANSGDQVGVYDRTGELVASADFAVADAPKVVAGVSLEYDLSNGWCVSGASAFNDAGELGTPGAAGSCASASFPPFGAGELVISEVMYNPSGTEPNGEWFEVVSKASAERSLSGLVIESGIRAFTVEALRTVQPGERVVFCRDVAAGPAGCLPYGNVALANSGSSFQLRTEAGVVIDRLAYGGGSPWPASTNGVSIELSEFTLDAAANDEAGLWCLATALPGNSAGLPNDCNTGAPVLPVPGDVVITEILYDSLGTEPDMEWFELTSLSADRLDLTGGQIVSTGIIHTITEPTFIAPGERKVFCRDTVVGPAGCTLYKQVGLKNSGTDDLSVLAPNGDLLDEVIYMGGAPWPGVPAGTAIELSEQALDPAQNDLGQLWCGATASAGIDLGTPGAVNGCNTAPIPGPAAGELVISEIMYNPSGTEPGAEWIELVNVSGGDLSLAGVSFTDAAGGGALAGGPVIAAGARVVLCSDVAVGPAGCVAYGGVTLNNTTDTLSILAADGTTVVDQVAYGTTGSWPASTNGVSIELSEAAMSAAGNDVATAWCAATAPLGASDFGTPGAANSCP